MSTNSPMRLDAELTTAAVQAVLDGRSQYDRLNAHEQASVRAGWAERIEQTRKNLRLDRLLAAQGREIVELGADGKLAVLKPAAARRSRAAR